MIRFLMKTLGSRLRREWLLIIISYKGITINIQLDKCIY